MKDTKHTVYQTTCLINDHYYIGVHSTLDPNDSYLGSGTELKQSVKDHGKENHKKEILLICETKEEAYEMEKLYVGKSFNDKLNMNQVPGGWGGFDLTELQEQKRLEAIRKSFEEGISKGWQLGKDQRSEMFSGDKNGFYKKTHSKDTRAKIGKAAEISKEIEEQRILQYHAEPKTWGWKKRLGEKYGIKSQKVAPWLKHRGLETEFGKIKTR